MTTAMADDGSSGTTAAAPMRRMVPKWYTVGVT
jgi:hypothetical protein